MSELDDDLKDIDHSVNFNEDRPDIDPLLAKLDRLQAAIAKHEQGFSAAVEAYNAAIQAARERYFVDAGEYLRFKDTAHRVCSTIEFEMRQRIEEKEQEWTEWGQTEDGRRHEKWLDVWLDFDDKVAGIGDGRTERISVPKTQLSAMIAALPRRPDDLKPSEVPRAEVDRRIAPKIASSVAASWRRIDDWLHRNAPMLAPKMREGATPGAIANAERALGLELPDAVRASYAIHDGSGVMRLFPSGYYLSLEEMLEHYGIWRNTEEEDRAWVDGYGLPKGPVQLVHYHLKWIPLTDSGGGDHTVIDLAPAEGGKVGQLVDFSHETGPECVAATGLAEYLAYLADGLEARAATIGEETYLIWNTEPDTPRSGYVLPPGGPKPATSAAGESAKRYFEFAAGTSNKFWEVSCEGVGMTTRYGKVGTQGQSTSKAFDSPEKASSETDKIIAKKLKEGYVEKTR